MKNIIVTLLFVYTSTATDIVIDWKVVKNATKYEVTYVSDSGFSMSQIINNTEYIIKDVEEGRKYIVTVRALDDKNNSSPTSIPLCIQIDKTNKIDYLKQPETKFKIK